MQFTYCKNSIKIRKECIIIIIIQKTMKKIFLLTLVLITTLSACNADTSSVKNETVETTVETTEAKNKIEKSGNISWETFDISDVEDGKTIQEISYVQFSIDGNDKLNASLKEANEQLKNGAESFKSNMAEDARERIGELGDDFGHYSYNLRVEVKRNDDEYVSILVYIDSFTMGAHGSTYRLGLNFDAKTGERLYIEDMVSDKNDLKAYLYDWCGRNLTDEVMLKNSNQVIADYFKDLHQLQFIIQDKDLIVLMQEYEFSVYAEGPVDIEINDEISNIGVNKDLMGKVSFDSEVVD